MQNLIEKIKKQKWFEGVHRKVNLLTFSLRVRGENKYIKKEYGKKFLQDRILISKSNNNVHMLGLSQAKVFHTESRKRIIKNPKLLLEKIKQDELVLEELNNLSKRAKKNKDLLKIIELFKLHNFLFFLCFSLNCQLFKSKSKIKDKKIVKKVIAKYNQWQDKVPGQEDKILKNIKPILISIAKTARLKINDLYYLEIQEFIRGLKNGFNKKIKSKINKRKNEYVFICLNGIYKVIDDIKKIREIKDFFKDKKIAIIDSNEIKGSVAYKVKGRIKGRVKIVKNPKKKINIRKGTILVAIQTTPDFIPIIKKFSAIVVDEGGITSHAAIISREFRIPCIIGTKIATRTLKDKDLVEVDTNKGIVKIIEK